MPYFIALFMLTTMGFGSPLQPSTQPDKNQPVEISNPGIIGYRVVGTDGKLMRLGMDTEPKPIALVFLDHQCSISNQYAVTLNTIAKICQGLDIDFIGVYSDPTLSLQTLTAHKTTYRLDFPLILDATGDLGLRLKPTAIPEAMLIGRNDHVIYRGLIDNRFAAIGRKRRQITKHYLKDAILNTAGGKPAPSSTLPIGCFFEAWKDMPAQVNYNRHVEPLLRANCSTCHVDGGIAPFPLTTYEQTKRRAGMVAAVTQNGLMPPWRPKAQPHAFRDERILSQRQKDVLMQWALTQYSEGLSEEKIPPSPVATSIWRLGEPDLELQMVEPFEVPASGEDIYRYFVIPMGLDRQQEIVAMDFLPGDPQVVHHVNFFVDYEGRARLEDAKDAAPGFSVFAKGSFMDYDGAGALGGWAPGADPYRLPPGLASPIWGGGDLVIEVHYHLTGSATVDQSSIAFYFSKEPAKKHVYGLFLGTQDVAIPAGETDYCRKFYMNVPVAMTLIDITPHMHYLGKATKVIAILPDQTEITLIDIPDWDLNWQNIYVYSEPIQIPAGSRIEAWFSYDNSVTNPANPNNPPKPVQWGWTSDDEMSEVYLTILAEDDQATQRLVLAARKAWTRSAICP